MKNLRFKARSSAGEWVYDIKVKQHTDGSIAVTCSCPAADRGYWCRHRVSLLDGDPSAISCQNDDDFSALKTLLNGSPIQQAYLEKLAADIVLVAATEEVKRANSAFSRALLGLPTSNG